MRLGPEALKLMICLWHGVFQERGEGRGGRHELCSGMNNAAYKFHIFLDIRAKPNL
ncbi:hypothetical protein AVEN_232923-1, partial [Araneus ventricosus]